MFSKDTHESFDLSVQQIQAYITSKYQRGNIISFSGYAVEAVIGRVIWPIFLIMAVGSMSRTGMAVSVSMVISLAVFMFIGSLTDRIDRFKLVKIGTAFYLVAWILRIFVDTLGKAIVIDSYKNISQKILHIPWPAHNYDLASRDNSFLFVVSRELVFNATAAIPRP